MAKHALAILVVLSAATGAGAQVVGPIPPDPTPVVRMGVEATPFAPGVNGHPMTITMTNQGPRRGPVLNQPTDIAVWGWSNTADIVSLSVDSGYACSSSSGSFICHGPLAILGTVTIKATVRPPSCGPFAVNVVDFLPANNLWNGYTFTTVQFAGELCGSGEER